ncbi:MAG: hypothetical protein OZSIB_2786 [Candidatus Ozemobacter sibiricus]|uniref:VWFA domain-containing protein n=1 Tax=Candidatus Ozemobacter sibiricus TaxID=2268124 RepID=A0A367ZS04_9BACT|nr:MAG: hypothetical protein OZSIB_2786 [Candidatus Ozemobacter sibiricus]
MVEVPPRSAPISIRYWHYLAFLAVVGGAGLLWLWWALRSPWGAGNSTIESWRPYLAGGARAPSGAKPVDNLNQTLRLHRVLRLAEKRFAVLFSVTDAQGAPLVVVPPGDVQVALADPTGRLQPVTVERVTPLHQMASWGERAHFSCVLDWSGSMFADDLQALKDNYSSFLKALTLPYAGAVYKFQTDVRQIIGLSSDAVALENAVRQDIPQGSTALYAAIDTALQPIQKAPWLRFQMVTTDGMDNVGGATLEDVIKRARLHEVSLFVLGFGWVQVDVLERLAEETDGYYVYVPDSRDLATWFTRLAGIVNNVQVAEVSAPFDLARPGGLELTVRAGAASLKRRR